jgi:hypothetical protein
MLKPWRQAGCTDVAWFAALLALLLTVWTGVALLFAGAVYVL